jgi:hypothetical protein
MNLHVTGVAELLPNDAKLSQTPRIQYVPAVTDTGGSTFISLPPAVTRVGVLTVATRAPGLPAMSLYRPRYMLVLAVPLNSTAPKPVTTLSFGM